MNNDKHLAPLDTTTFQRIRNWYLFALATIALSIIVAQILIQHHLNSQLDDSKVINVAGRQRAYSQKLTKEVLLLKELPGPRERTRTFNELKETLNVWKASHQALQHGDMALGISKIENEEVQVLFKKINPRYDAIVGAVENILTDYKETGKSIPNPLYVDILLKNEGDFLNIMDTIVNKYDALSKSHLQNLKFKEYLLLAISLLILILEIFFIFKPLSLQIRNTIKNLIVAQGKSDESTKEIKKLFKEKEKSLQELQELNFVIDNAALFASIGKDGNVVFISKKFDELLGRKGQDINMPLYEILTTDEGQQQYLAEVLKSNRKNIRTEEIKIKTAKGESLWLDMSIIPMHQSSAQQSTLILCSDITERKRTEIKVAQLTQANYEETMRQKQLQASQIVEGQEEERKRIAKDIHDGIGQMLTALKFNIESINLNNKKKAAEKIEFIKGLASDLIKGVRTATFNLTPPELSDHGIFPALLKMTLELSKLTGKNILFENKTGENIRFNSLAETNIYRVVQEAVNNAIKYAEANYILVSINSNDHILSVVIDDDGKGFDGSISEKVPKNTSEGGMGLFFMKERINYINGRLFINSVPGKGTRVTINYKF
jgi:PAS domain S-box-containing protein